MARTNFEKMEVYRAAEQLADAIWAIVVMWDGFARRTVGQQLVRAADSVPANIAEGTGRATIKDKQHFVKGKQHFVRVARGSLYETQNWLRRAYQRGLWTDEQVTDLKATLDVLPRMLNAYLRSLSQNPKRTQ